MMFDPKTMVKTDTPEFYYFTEEETERRRRAGEPLFLYQPPTLSRRLKRRLVGFARGIGLLLGRSP